MPARRRRRAQQWEWAEQAKLAARLTKMLDPACVFWTAVDNQPWSKVAGIMRKRRGCRSGTPDLLILHKGKLIGLEMKSRVGRVSKVQKQVRLEMLRAGGMWWLCRTARAALVALHRSGVGLRTRAGRRWKPPVLLKPWEQPVADLEQPMVWHAAVLRSGARTGRGSKRVSAPVTPRLRRSKTMKRRNVGYIHSSKWGRHHEPVGTPVRVISAGVGSCGTGIPRWAKQSCG
jgi:hypothetical protein